MTTATNAYSAQDLEDIAAILAWLEQTGVSRSALSKMSGHPSGTVSQVLNRKYISSPTRQLKDMLAAIRVHQERQSEGTPGYVQGTMHKLVGVVCDRTRKNINFGLLIGHVGVGKTRTLREYTARNQHTLLVEARPAMTPTALLTNILRQLHVPVPNRVCDMLDAVIGAVQGRPFLLIVDEAASLLPDSLHNLRRILDLAHVGVVLADTERLNMVIQRSAFDQIRSRVGMAPKTVTQITRDDADMLARDKLREFEELDDDTLDALWHLCDGSARVLTEGLLTNIRDYCKAKAVTPEFVYSVAHSVLSMDKQMPRKKAVA